VAVWNLFSELSEFGVELPVIGAAALTVSLSAGVLYAAVAVRKREMRRPDAWAISLGGLSGGVLASTAFGTTLAIRIAEGRPISEPQFPLIVLGAMGTLGGVVVARWYTLARERAREAEQARDAMAFTNSLLRHDVLNGIQIIDANAGVLADSGDETVTDRAEAIKGQSESLGSLITDVRSVTAVLTGDVTLDRIDLSELLDDVIVTLRQSHPDATLELDCPPDTVVVGTDALEPVFSNLVTNAIKHAGEDVRVNISAERRGDSVIVRVADDGPGIPAAERERVFEQGVSTDGGGQGLYVADTIVDRLDGEISVEESQWGGAAFVVELRAAGDGP
jgi:signal transduction histidine kinase